MDPILATAGGLMLAGVVGLGYSMRGFYLARKSIQQAEHDRGASFAARRADMLHEVEMRKSEEQRYRESIDAAFATAERDGALMRTMVTYDAIESDQYFKPNEVRLLTRFEPVMTQELAEKIRDYEIQYAFNCEDTGRAVILVEARSMIQWAILEVPKKWEPKNLKGSDRIRYPDLYSFTYSMPPLLIDAARRMLDYNEEYVQAEAQKRQEAEDKEDFYD